MWWQRWNGWLNKQTGIKGQDGKGDPLGIVQELKIWLYYQIVSAQTRISPKKCDPENSQVFSDTNRSLNPSEMAKANVNKQKKKNFSSGRFYHSSWPQS